MNTQLVEIQPRELKFIFEVKKQSSCAVHLANVTDQYVAFKVKTTSPKKYCVRPNVGIIKPKSTCDFTVTMQAQKSAPSELQCKDKFLIQSTVVPFGTTEEEIMPGMFSKDSQKYIDETKLRVALTIAPNSPVKTPVDEVLNQEASFENMPPNEPHSPVLLPVKGVVKQEPFYENPVPKDNGVESFPPPGLVRNQNGVENFPPPDLVRNQNGVENFPPPDLLMKKVEEIKNVKNVEESRSLKVTDNSKPVSAKDVEFYPDKDDETKQVKDVEEVKLKLTQIEELRSKISAMDSKLVEAEYTIKKLKEEKSSTISSSHKLLHLYALDYYNLLRFHRQAILRRKSGPRKVQVGFPPLFVCMVALISLAIGFLLRA
ncbi:hypothetical protein BUALT_Bualt14G0077900 [Buddleja alternifolia]|uniref:MSP domain-containing protein n=1 Tax=Buddleja alternifolia TaxID=168488 RepID=A0AAV6WHR4_9LAMI|nr:hypothetical protein BUALT_Bualt14G0077900 [Buddleja alternifolia]